MQMVQLHGSHQRTVLLSTFGQNTFSESIAFKYLWSDEANRTMTFRTIECRIVKVLMLRMQPLYSNYMDSVDLLLTLF